MRRSAGPAAHAILILAAALLASCGPEPELGGIQIRFSSRALLERSANVFVYFYGPEIPCSLVRQTVPRPPSILGPFMAPVTPEGRERGISFTRTDIPVGTYVVFADAQDADGANVGTGCAPGQQVIDREVSQIQLVVSEGP